MDKEQLVDEIDAIDRQILHLTQPMPPIKGQPVEGYQVDHDRGRQEVQRLAARKAELRLELVKA